MTVSLKPCPKTPNCVSTLATDERHAIAPFPFSGSAEEAMGRLLDILRAAPRTTIVVHDATSARVEFRTRVFRFVDDAHFVADPDAKVIHFRSASRLGAGDLGVNRKRMERLRARFLAR
jgi:uncharacterized protein (DUF1499 family)